MKINKILFKLCFIFFFNYKETWKDYKDTAVLKVVFFFKDIIYLHLYFC